MRGHHSRKVNPSLVPCSRLVGSNYRQKFLLPGLREELFSATSLTLNAVICCQDGKFKTTGLVLASLSPFWKNILDTLEETNYCKQGLEGSGEDMIVVILPDVSLDEVREVHEMLFSTDTQGVLQTVPHHLVDFINVYSQFISEDEPVLVPQKVAPRPRPLLRKQRHTSEKASATATTIQQVTKVPWGQSPDTQAQTTPIKSTSKDRDKTSTQSVLQFLNAGEPGDMNRPGNDKMDEKRGIGASPPKSPLVEIVSNQIKSSKNDQRPPITENEDMIFGDELVLMTGEEKLQNSQIKIGQDEDQQNLDEVKARIDQALEETKGKTRKMKTFNCGVCDRDFTTKQALCNHVWTHEGQKNFECDVENCGKRFSSAAGVRYHRRCHFPSNHQCTVCQRWFTGQSHLDRHLRSKHFEHSDKKRFTCDQCFKTYTDPNSLARHKLAHKDIRPHKCRFCPKGFKTKPQLKIHERTHTGEKPYACSTCSDRFVTASQLKSHFLHRHEKKSVPKNHLCTECGAAFPRPYALRVHMMVHSGELPFRCEECGKGCKTRQKLRNHMTVHTGEKPYKCHTCGKTFRAAGSITKHFKRNENCRLNAGPGAYSIPKGFHLPPPNTLKGLCDVTLNEGTVTLTEGQQNEQQFVNLEQESGPSSMTLESQEGNPSASTTTIKLLPGTMSGDTIVAHIEKGESVDTIVLTSSADESRLATLVHPATLVDEHVDRVVQLSTLNRRGDPRSRVDPGETIQIHQLHQ